MRELARSKAFLAVTLIASFAVAEEVVVKVQVLQIRSDKGSMHPVVDEAHLNDRLTVLRRDPDGWLNVKFRNSGFVKESALAARGATGLSGLTEGLSGLTGTNAEVGASLAAKGVDDDAGVYANSAGLRTDGLEHMINSRKRVTGVRWQQFAREGRVGAAK